MAYVSGKKGRARINGTNWKVTNWTGNFQCELQDVTNMEGNGFAENIDGIESGDVTVDMVYDDTQSPGTALRPGQLLAVELFPDKNNSGAKYAGNVRIGGHTPTTPVRGPVTLSITGQFSGTFTYPS